MAKKTTLDSLAAIVSKGFASADKKFTALAEDIADIKKTMATKEDIAAVRAEMATKDDIAGIDQNLATSKIGSKPSKSQSKITPATAKRSTTPLSASPQSNATSASNILLASVRISYGQKIETAGKTASIAFRWFES